MDDHLREAHIDHPTDGEQSHGVIAWGLPILRAKARQQAVQGVGGRLEQRQQVVAYTLPLGDGAVRDALCGQGRIEGASSGTPLRWRGVSLETMGDRSGIALSTID